MLDRPLVIISSAMAVLLKCLLLSFLAISVCAASEQCYNNQEDDYIQRHDFLPRKNGGNCSVTPFFSPNNSLDAYLMMIGEANESISIATPSKPVAPKRARLQSSILKLSQRLTVTSRICTLLCLSFIAAFTSWNRSCIQHREDCHHNKCYGCPVHFYRHESFPLFSALLNAMHTRGIKVRILTNYYNVPVCPGKVSALHWMSLNGAEVRLYKSTTFLHAKFMMIDRGRKVLLSSVNFSETSFELNREAGVIVSDCNITDFYSSVFNVDFDVGANYPVNDLSISSDEKSYIQSKDIMTSPIVDTNKASKLSLKTFTNVEIPLAYVAPDFARETFFEQLSSVRSSLLVHIYAITDKKICQKVKELHDNGTDITILVSRTLVGGFQYSFVKVLYIPLIRSMLCDRLLINFVWTIFLS